MGIETSGWTPIALSRDVPAGMTRAVRLEGRELVIWRGADGSAHVWEDRCPHRGMRLSFGFVRGNALNCLYHGWQYGSTASCQRIPAHPDLTVPPTIRANAYASAETGGLIWVSFDTLDTLPVVASLQPVASVAARVVDFDRSTIFEHAGDLTIGWHRMAPNSIMLHALTTSVPTPSHLAALRLLRSALEAGDAT